MTNRAKTTAASTAGSFAPDLKAEPTSVLDAEPVCLVDSRGTKRWTVNGVLHRIDGPAIEWADGYVEFYQNGKRHRLDGPAIDLRESSSNWVSGLVDSSPWGISGPAHQEWHVDGVRVEPDKDGLPSAVPFGFVAATEVREGMMVKFDGLPVRVMSCDRDGDRVKVRALTPSGVETDHTLTSGDLFDANVRNFDAAKIKKLLDFVQAVPAHEVLKMASGQSRPDETDHFVVASRVKRRGLVDLAIDESRARLDAHQRTFGLYGEASEFRSHESWERDPILVAERSNASSKDLAWDRHLGIRIEADRALRMSTNMPEGESDWQAGQRAHDVLLSHADLPEDRRRTLIDFALRFGPYGRYRDMAD